MANEALKPEDPITVKEAMEVAEEAMLLGSIPQPRGPEEFPQAIAVFPGLGEWWRVAHAVDMLRRADPRHTTHLFITGYNCKENTHVNLTTLNLNFGLLGQVFTVVWKGTPSEDYTPQQAEWLTRELRRHGISVVGLVVSQYHMLRAYLTLLKRCRIEKLPVSIMPLIPNVSPLAPVPETGQPMIERYCPEIERIVRYRRKGDIASHEEFKGSIRGLWSRGGAAYPPVSLDYLSGLAQPFAEAARDWQGKNS